ncbi:hypothetical protein [Marinimicrobium locisalis]|uniref:hypothetical protein n=1 Tax=Marinimicrobium locisalis TaxID=546022 RepID=UPI003221B9A6
MKAFFLLLFFLTVFCGNASARPAIDTTEVPEYDYTQTHYIIFYGEGDYVVLANPFEFPAPVMGALVYEVILRYASQLQPIEAPLSDPTHVLDLIMMDDYGERRIGQRLYLGDTWLSDGKRIAHLSSEDYQWLTGLLNERYAHTKHNSSEQLSHLRRPNEDELPDSWLGEFESITTAADRMGLNRQHFGKSSSDQISPSPAPDSTLSESGSERTETNRQKTNPGAQSASSTPGEAHTNAEPPNVTSITTRTHNIAQKSAPASGEGSTLSEAHPENDQESRWPLLASLMLAGIALMWVLKRKRLVSKRQ